MERILSLSVMVALLAGCTWVKMTPEGEQARVLTESQARNCTSLGVTTVSMPTKVVGIPLNEKKVNVELEKLARNAVSEFKGADSVRPVGDARNGKQTFEVYDCLKD
ncbi:MAG TPA: DUF4156 domain-containing protein [Gammaproteobacteria bacterium]|nr:DUF4156 domain-containing protein [Gammaproteobacteria bacterium]